MSRQNFLQTATAGFNGLDMVEGVKVGVTIGETMTKARARRALLEKVLAPSD